MKIKDNNVLNATELNVEEAEVFLSDSTRFVLYEHPKGVLSVYAKDALCIKPCMSNSIEITTSE